MQFLVERDLTNFEFWQGAKYTREHMTDEQVEQIEEILECDCPGEYYTETQINNLFWFDSDLIAQWLGFEDFEQLEKHNEESGEI